MVISIKAKIIETYQNRGDQYFFTHEEKYGLRFGVPDDANEISELYIQEYGFEYVNPMVYDIDKLEKHIEDPRNYWIIGENIISKEIFFVSLMEFPKRYKAYSGKTILKPTYRGNGLSSILGFNTVKFLKESGVFDNCLKIDSMVRSHQIGAQKLSEAAGGIPYGFVPALINFGDKRFFKFRSNRPFPRKIEESAILYKAIFPNLWKLRSSEVHLLKDELILFLYDYIKNFKKPIKLKMKKDNVHIHQKGEPYNYYDENFEISKDLYNSIATLNGYVNEDTLKYFFSKFHHFRVILWHIPVNEPGINSMKIAAQKGFKPVGYSLGEYVNNLEAIDTVLFSYIKKYKSDFSQINPTSKNFSLYSKILRQFN